MIRFILGMIIMIGSLVFLGCPLRMVIRMSAGDLNAWVALIGFILGVGTGTIMLKKGSTLGRAHETNQASGTVLPILMIGVLILALFTSLLEKQHSGTGKYACTNHRFINRRSCVWSICSEIKNVFCWRYS